VTLSSKSLDCPLIASPEIHQAPNLECFVNRIATNPERLANVYFDTVLVLRAIARAAPYLEAYDIETARSQNDLTGIEADRKVKQQLKAVLEMARESGASAFDEKALFNGDDAIVSHASRSALTTF
jgi:hypothetical protein